MTEPDAELPGVSASHEPMLYWVGLYLVRLDYGGPEEGGHWYPSGGLETDPALYRILGQPPRGFFEEAEADAFLAEMEMNLPLLNAGQPSRHASTSRGSYELHVMHATSLPLAFPDQGPRYE